LEITVGWAVSEDEILEAEQLTGPQRSIGVGASDMRVCRASVDGKLAAAFWATSNVFLEDGLGIGYELDDDQAWLSGAYVEKSFRRRGIHSSILKFMIPNLIASGMGQVLLAVNPDNIESRKVHEKYAKRTVGSLIAIRFLSVAICSVKGDLSGDRWITLNAKRKPILIRLGNR
jgi:GNAT superfamily N-acetyltransferase